MCYIKVLVNLSLDDLMKTKAFQVCKTFKGPWDSLLKDLEV